MKRRVALGLAVVILVALFVAARRAASWRPQLMAADSVEALMLTPRLNVTRSSSGRWVVYDSLTTSSYFLVDRTHPRSRRRLDWGQPVFSRDEKLLFSLTSNLQAFDPHTQKSAFISDKTPVRMDAELEDLRTGNVTKLEPISWGASKKNVSADLLGAPVISPDNSVLTAVIGTTVVRWNIASGKLLSRAEGGPFGAYTGGEPCAGGDKVCGSSDTKFFVYNARTGAKEGAYWGAGEAIAGTDFYGGEAWGRTFYIARISDGKRIFQSQVSNPTFLSQSPIFSTDGRLVLVALSKKAGLIQAQMMEVATGRVVLRKELPEFNRWMFDDNDHVLTRDAQGRVYRWRVR